MVFLLKIYKQMDIIYLVAGLVVGGIVGFFIARVLSNSKMAVKRADLEKQIGILQSKYEELQVDSEKIEQQFREESIAKQEVEKQVVAKNVAFQNLEEKLKTERKQLEELQTKFQTEFENIANKILKQNTLEFSQTSAKNMGDILNPLKEKITNFERKVEDTYQKGLKDQTNLLAVLKNLQDLSLKLDKDAQDLTKALKSDSKQQGNWGEVVLERMLEDSGLIKNQEYFVQETGRNEEGNLVRPDVVIKLPQDKYLIIDSKVSLTAYHDFISKEDEQQKAVALKKHIESIKNHVKELNEKNYQSMNKLDIPDFVLMFMPVESAFALAVQNDPPLFNFAWEKKIVIVSPTTLLATLKTIESIWRQEKQTRNALEIAEQGGKLYDKFVGFLTDLEKIGTNIDRASVAYNEAHKKLKSGKGNILGQVEKMKTLGAKTSKSLPQQYLELED